MEQAALRQCLRASIKSARGLRCRAGDMSARRNVACVAASICPARQISNSTLSSAASIPKISRNSSAKKPQLTLSRRTYSSESSPLETIAGGESGIAAEAARTHEALTAPEHLDEKEKAIWEMLMKELQCVELEVKDISGGCGSMYGIDIVSERFRGLNMLKQQRLVNQVLGEEIKGWHGVQLKTRAP